MDISIEGPLSKWTNVVIGWQYRWFVLDEGAGVLWYYTVCTGYIFMLGAGLQKSGIVFHLLLNE